MKRLKVDFEEIAICMEDQNRYDHDHYLDTQTGEVVTISGEVKRAVEDGDEEKLGNLPGWQKREAEIAEEILGESDRYVWIEDRPSYEGYNLMSEFADTVKDTGLREKLAIALDGKGAFRRFKDVLAYYPEEEKRWFSFKSQRMEEEITNWLNSIGIEPVKD
ncbi:MAG: hypothetical protein SCARUB_01911 [Candidatus Scalindua rubra]|uniref:Uncharacterized protein n=1 Tax=Candidatus Scalindua rubra TaxID=1872076 RepID=A0A1E3XBH0_9BACT|nr:MAG: hypothetical protein SCARUB_01911 [Candidatus Scalindua rubra]